MTEKVKKPPRIGSREHDWLYTARDANGHSFMFTPTTHGKPPAVLRRLVEKGLMHAQKVQTLRWMPKNQYWSVPQPAPEHRCGLTHKGLRLLNQVAAWHKQEFERKQAEKAK